LAQGLHLLPQLLDFSHLRLHLLVQLLHLLMKGLHFLLHFLPFLLSGLMFGLPLSLAIAPFVGLSRYSQQGCGAYSD